MTKPRGFMKYNVNIPTRVDVDALIKEIGIPEVGSHIPYSRIVEIIKVDRKTGRWNSVVNAWKKELRKKHGIELRAVANEGFEVLDDNGKTNKFLGYITKGANAFVRAEETGRLIDRTRLTDDNKKVFDHATNFTAAVRLADITVAKQPVFPELDKAPNGTPALVGQG